MINAKVWSFNYMCEYGYAKRVSCFASAPLMLIFFHFLSMQFRCLLRYVPCIEDCWVANKRMKLFSHSLPLSLCVYICAMCACYSFTSTFGFLIEYEKKVPTKKWFMAAWLNYRIEKCNILLLLLFTISFFAMKI